MKFIAKAAIPDAEGRFRTMRESILGIYGKMIVFWKEIDFDTFQKFGFSVWNLL
jgi:hypothetical protein